MKNNYKRTQLIIACVILCSLLLQNCGPLSTYSQPSLYKAKEKKRELNITQRKGLSCLLNQEFTAQKGYLVIFHEQDGKLQANVKTDASQKEPNYSNVPVLLAKDIELSELTLLLKPMQESCIQVEQFSSGRPSRIVVVQGGLKGGMKRKREDSQENTSLIKSEIPKQKILKTELPELPIELWEYILSYLSVEDIKQASYTCRLFKDIITSNLRNRWMIEEKDFRGLQRESISRFEWNHLIREAKNLPEEFWPYVAKTQIHILDLEFNQIGDSGAIKLAEALPNTQIHTLNLWDNQIGDSGTNKLAAALPNTQIHTLDLGSNQIGDSGAIKLAEALPNTQFHTLNLEINEIGDLGAIKLAEALPNTQIHTLNLESNQIGASGAIKLAEALPNTQIHTLYLRNNQIGDSGVTKLAEALPTTQIHTLNLESNQIGASGAIKLAEGLPNSQIHTLNLSWNQIGASGTAKLAKALPNSQIHILDLSQNEIGDSGAIKLAEALPNSHIHTLNLQLNEIGASGATKLADDLPNTQIHALNLSWNQISAEMQQLLKEQNPNVKFEF